MKGHTKEAGLEICKQLGIDPARVLGINIFVLNRTLVVKTLDGVMNCSLVEDRNEVGELIFRIVKDGGVGSAGKEIRKEVIWRSKTY